MAAILGTDQPDIVYLTLKEEHVSKAGKLLADSFVHDEVLAQVVDIPYDERLEYDQENCRMSVDDGTSLVAIDNATAEIVGVLAGQILQGQDYSQFDQEDLECSVPNTALILQAESLFFTSPDFRKNPECKILNVFKLGVHKDYRRLGIAKKLVEMHEDIARQKGCSWILATPSGQASQNLYSKSGYLEIGEIFYRDFVFNVACVRRSRRRMPDTESSNILMDK
ncbi:uncharacterized protein [Ptychodera flava]|uniref:uncharacterized protein n=1 Tax=Ptychodera flava TaxID=63121 RepID=UPI003969D0D3